MHPTAQQQLGGPSTARIWAVLGVLYIVWGTTYLGIAEVNKTIPTLIGAGTRFLIAGGVLFAWQLARTPERPDARHWKAAAIIGALLLLGGNTGVAWAERTVPTGIVSLIIALTPLWLALFDRVILRSSPLGWRVVVGLVGGFTGALLLVGVSARWGHVPLPGMLTAVGATLCWATGALYARRARLPKNSFLSSGMQMLAGGIVIMTMAVLTGEFGQLHLSDVSRTSWIGLIYLIVIGSWVGFSSFIWLIRNARTSLVSTYAYVNPMVAVTLGWLVLGETLSPRVFLAGGVILASVAMIVSAGGPQREETGDPAAGELLMDPPEMGPDITKGSDAVQ
jgi:drug/metabolite transporter (DMT)-like permease